MALWTAALAVLLSSGCVTTETSRIAGANHTRIVDSNDDGLSKTEVALLEACEDEPRDSKNWFRLGEYYERSQKYSKAVACYGHMQGLFEEEQKATGGKTLVGGLYLLGKCHAILKQWEKAIHYLTRVVKVQPKELHLVLRVPQFAEAHYLLGAIYYEHRMYEEAEKHLITFTELRQGDRRADGMLIGIDDKMRPEKRSWYAEKDNAPAREAGKINEDGEGKLTVEATAPPAKGD